MPHTKRPRRPAKPQVKPSEKLTIRCYHYRADLSGNGFETVSYAKACALLLNESARLVNGDKDIQMNPRAELKARDRSCGWHGRLVHLNAVGDYAVRKMTEMLDPKMGRIDQVRIVTA